MAEAGVAPHQNPRFRVFFLLVIILSIAGAALSLYTLAHHLELHKNGSTNFACNINAALSCDDVARSPYSEFAEVPLGVYGIGFFLSLAFVLIVGQLSRANERASMQGYALIAAVGSIGAIALALISAIVIGKFCISCIGVYLITFALFALVPLYYDLFPKPWDFKQTTNGALSGAFIIVALVAAYKTFAPTTQPAKVDTAAIEKMVQEATQQGNQPNAIPFNKSAYVGAGEDYRKGPDDAKIVITEFADFQCPACGVAAKMMKQIASEYANDVLVVFRNYPLDNSCNSQLPAPVHPHACLVAKLARCAGDAGKFWQYHDRAFENQRDINPENARRWASELGLDKDTMDRCLSSADISGKIAEDIAVAGRVGVNATPSIFVNGKPYTGGLEIETMRLYLDKMIGR